MMLIRLYGFHDNADDPMHGLGAAMEILVLTMQLLSFALLLYGAGLCVWFVHREWQEAELQRQVDVQPKPASAATAPVEQPPESDLHHGTPA